MLRDPVADWRELSALYEQAELLEDRELKGFLEGLHTASRRLIPDLERMLGARARARKEGFLETLPTLPGPADRLSNEWDEGSSVGAYRLVRHIGSGGMAEVWLADRVDGAFERQVAIKLLFNHPTRERRDHFVERFKRERDILASLHHSHIAALHDAGVTARGQPWLALEFVSGEPITAWADRRRLGMAERMRVFCQVLLAVEYAHANLVIHRDLKPSNILVTEHGQVKLLDFGIAKLMEAGGASLDDTELTRQGGRPLTLQYASPEQLGGRPLTTASDVYSLGVVLYELLCGARPFDEERASSAARLEDAILHGDAPAPSRRATDAAAEARSTSRRGLQRALAGDLDAVACKALSGEPARRYASVEALRLDVERWSSGHPVLAQPASLAYRARKFYLRHRLGVWSGTAAACSVIGLGVATVMSGMKAQTESGRAIASRDFVVQLFRLADPEQSGGREMSPRELLEAGRRKALDTFASQPRLQADVLGQIGVMQGYAGDYKQADVNLSQAVELLAREGRNRHWAEAQIKLAHNAIFLGDLGRASAAVTAVGARLDAFRGDTALLASYLTVKGIVARTSLDVPGAIDDLSRAVALSTQARGERHVDTIDALRALADAHTESGHFAEAISLLDDASRRAHANPDVGRRDLLAIEADAAITTVQAGRYAGSAERLKSLIARCESEFGRGGEPCVGLVNYLSWLALRLDDRETSRSLVARLLEIAADDASPWRQAGSANLCAEFLAVEGSLDAHPSLLAQIHRIAQAEKLPPRDRTSATLVLARAALQKGHWNSAEAEANRALDDQHAQARPHLDLVAKAKLMRGLARHFTQRHDEALRDIQDAVADMTRARGKDHALIPLYRSNEFIVLNAMNQSTEARRTLEWALETMVPAYGNAPVVERLRRLLAAPEAQSQNPDVRQLRDFFL